jgi:hypothetical protein
VWDEGQEHRSDELNTTILVVYRQKEYHNTKPHPGTKKKAILRVFILHL